MNILITGCGGLIGSAITEDLLKSGANVILCDLKKNKFLKKIMIKYKSQIYFKKTDITKIPDLEKFIKLGLKKFKKIDGAIHCAYPKSKNFGKKFEDLKIKDLNYDLSNQLGSSIIFSQLMMKVFKKQGCGNLILLSSIMGIKTPDFDVYNGTNISSPIEYSAIKAGIISIVKYLAKYFKKNNIRVDSVSPGGILDNQNIKFIKNYRKKCSSIGLLKASDLCPIIRFLLSEDSKYINGQNIVVDDGWSL